MRTLAEMVSIIPVKGAIVAYPGNFVDEALGFTVGITYWFSALLLHVEVKSLIFIGWQIV